MVACGGSGGLGDSAAWPVTGQPRLSGAANPWEQVTWAEPSRCAVEASS
jgi:hypothetical protein